MAEHIAVEACNRSKVASFKSSYHRIAVKLLRRDSVEHMDSMVRMGWTRRGPCPSPPVVLPSISTISPIPSWLSLDHNTAWVVSSKAILVEHMGSWPFRSLESGPRSDGHPYHVHTDCTTSFVGMAMQE